MKPSKELKRLTSWTKTALSHDGCTLSLDSRVLSPFLSESIHEFHIHFLPEMLQAHGEEGFFRIDVRHDGSLFAAFH
jgi:hypothetical protein